MLGAVLNRTYITTLSKIISLVYSHQELTSMLPKAIDEKNYNLAIAIIQTGVQPSIKNLDDAVFNILADSLFDKLAEALFNSQENLALKIIESGVQPNALHLTRAIINNQEKLIFKIIESGVKPTDDDVKYLISYSDESLVIKLLDHAPKLTIENLSTAIHINKEDVAIKIIESGVQPNKWHFESALYSYKEKLMFKIIEAGVKPTSEHLDYAMRYDRENLVIKFIEIGIIPSYDNFKYAASVGREYLFKNSTKESKKALITWLVAKGHFTKAKELFKSFKIDDITINPIDLLTESLQIDLKGSIEQNKYGAIVNLIARTGIHIPEKYQKYIGNINDDIPENQFEFIHGLLHKLAEHYVLFAKKELLKHVDFSAENLKLVDQIFDPTSTAQEKYKVLQELRELNPNSKHLEKAKSAFDVVYFSVGTALEQIDHDFALEVLALNGIVPPKLEEPLYAYRGFHYNITDQALEDMFVYGHRAFSAAQNQKNLGYHVRNAWTKAVADGGNLWEFGGTYLSLEPYWSVQFAMGEGGTNGGNKGRNIFLELKTNAKNPVIFGKNTLQKEIVPSGMKGNEIAAIYELGADKKVERVFKNPYISDLSSYKIGDEVFYNAKAVENYIRLYKPTETYDNYEQFLENYIYQPERLDQFYENRPELPNQVCISPKTLSEIRLDMDVYSHMCVEE